MKRKQIFIAFLFAILLLWMVLKSFNPFINRIDWNPSRRQAYQKMVNFALSHPQWQQMGLESDGDFGVDDELH